MASPGLIDRLRLGGRRRKRDQRARAAASTFFDRTWYLARYPDVANGGVDPLRHYLEHGWREGRDPSPSFSTTAYLRSNPDVARAGINPLIHYIEHGLSEGRESSKHGRQAVPRRYLSEAFGPAAPCVAFPLDRGLSERWLRSTQLERAEDADWVAGMAVGASLGPISRSAIERAFARLAALSGAAPDGPEDASDDETREARGVLLDAWYLNHNLLRSRWHFGSDGRVVRAYQHVHHLALVGEGHIASTLDFFDANLINAFFPVLFVFSDPSGNNLSTRLIAFPSLCRGGLHYPELVMLASPEAGSSRRPIDLAAISDRLAKQLWEIRQKSSDAASRELRIRKDGPEANGPLFQPDFHHWLTAVGNVSPGPADCSNPVTLAGETRSAPFLELSSNMIPTIGWIAAADCGERNETAPFLINGAEPSQPAVFLNPPSDRGSVSNLPEFAAPTFWPRTNLRVPAAAIRSARSRALDDAELLVPMADCHLADGASTEAAITWLINVGDWASPDLEEGVEALALQFGSERDELILIGTNEPGSVAEHAFPGRARRSSSAPEALNMLTTPLAGFVGAGVKLHDRRCANVLRSMLVQTGFSTASCVIVSAEQRGKGWKIGVVDGGQLGQPDGGPAANVDDVMGELWRATYPVIQPPREFWLARTSCLREWQGQSFDRSTIFHAVTSLVTASYSGDGPKRGNPILEVPEAPSSNSLSAKLLFG